MMRNTGTKCCPAEIHERIKRDPVAWSALKRLEPLMETEHDDGSPAWLELRNCHCGSTLAVEVTVKEAA